MKKIILLSLALLGLGFSSKAQSTGKINLSIVDQQQNPTPEALVELLNAKDSSMVQFATTDTKGNVEFKDLTKGKYIAFVPEIGNMHYALYQFDIRNYDEAYDITLLCKACTEIIITGQAPAVNTKKENKIG